MLSRITGDMVLGDWDFENAVIRIEGRIDIMLEEFCVRKLYIYRDEDLIWKEGQDKESSLRN